MSTIEIISKIQQLKELEELIEEAQKEADALKDAIKEEMLKQNTEEMEVGKYIVRWTCVLSNRFDSTAFKKVMPDIYKVLAIWQRSPMHTMPSRKSMPCVMNCARRRLRK